MAYRRRNKPRVQWFPTLGVSFNPGGGTISYPGTAGVFTGVTAFGGPVAAVQPLIFDTPQELTLTGVTEVTGLSSIIGNQYFLRRIVGKFFVSRSRSLADGVPDGPPAIFFAAGLFIARADAGNVNSDLPIGGVDPSGVLQLYDVNGVDQIQEPWIWRRTWVLGYGDTGVGEMMTFPANNAQYGSIVDGPHVDAKTRRSVGNDDRLWLATSVGPVPGAAGGGANPDNVNFYFDYRVLGNLRRGRNSGKF